MILNVEKLKLWSRENSLRMKETLCFLRSRGQFVYFINDTFWPSESNSYLKVTATQKLQPLWPANSEGNGGCYLPNSTVMQLLSQNSFHLLHDTIKKTLNVFFC